MIIDDAWSFLWENPEDFLIVRDAEVFPDEDSGLIFEKKTRYYLGIENDDLYRSLVSRMRQAGVQTIESREFNPEPPASIKIIEQGRAAGLSRNEINERLRLHKKEFDHDETTQRIAAALAKTRNKSFRNA